jgi:uncharacterized membrane protein
VTKPDSFLPSLDEVFIVRIAFLFSAQFALYEGFADWNRGRADIHPEVAVLTLAIYAVSLLVIGMSLVRGSIVLRFRNLPLLPFLLATFTSIYVVATIAYNGSYRTDVLAYSHYAAILFATKGANPYTQNMANALAMFNVQPSDLTPLTSGTYLATFQYPALHFLVFVPFVWLGLAMGFTPDMRWVLVLFEIGTVLTLYVKGPQKLRLLLLLPLFAGSDLMINYTAASVSDALWVLPLLFAAFYMDRPIVSGIFYGVACAFKQLPWVLAPFLLIYMMRTEEGRDLREKITRTVKFALASVALFLVFNLPFMIMNMTAWFGNVLTPMTEDLVMLSQGASQLTQVGLLPVDKVFYTVMTGAVAVVLIVNYYVYFDKLKYVVWILPGIILWFSYRSLTSYIIYWMPLMLASLILWYKAERAEGVPG